MAKKLAPDDLFPWEDEDGYEKGYGPLWSSAPGTDARDPTSEDLDAIAERVRRSGGTGSDEQFALFNAGQASRDAEVAELTQQLANHAANWRELSASSADAFDAGFARAVRALRDKEAESEAAETASGVSRRLAFREAAKHLESLAPHSPVSDPDTATTRQQRFFAAYDAALSVLAGTGDTHNPRLQRAVQAAVDALDAGEVTSDPEEAAVSCWHCGDVLLPLPKPHCERCPEPGDCDVEGCQEPGCALDAAESEKP